MNSYLDDAIYAGLILESAIATPYNEEENIKRGNMAMRHVIASHKTEPRAMYRKDIGWIGFSWGIPGNPPPNFNNLDEAAKWWATLPGKTNAQKGSKVYAGGRGVSHIIAKRDFEAKWMHYFKGQNGIDVAMRCIEVIAKGNVKTVRQKREITLGKMRVSLVADSRWIESKEARAQGKKKEEFWLLSGFEIIDKDDDYGIFESAGVDGSRVRQSIPMHIMPTVTRHNVGATDSIESAGEWGGVGDPALHLRISGLHSTVQTWERQTQADKRVTIQSQQVNIGWVYDL